MTANRGPGAFLLALAGCALAFAVARLAGFTSGTDAALPYWVFLASVAGAIAVSEGAAQWIALTIPLILGAAIAIPADPARHLVYGVLLATAFAIAVVDVAREGTVPQGRAIALALLVVATRAFPFDGSVVPPLLLLAAGTVALVVGTGGVRASSPASGWAVAESPRPGAGEDARTPPGVSLAAFFLIVAIALATPLAPWDAALIPVAIALAFFAVRDSGRPRSAPAIAFGVASLVLALVVGRWMAAGVAVVLAARAGATFLRRRNGPAQPVPAAMIAIPALTASRAAGAIAGAGFAPGALFAPAEWWQRVAAALLFALSLFARPHPALLLALMALLVLSRRESPRASRAAAVTGALLFCAIALSAWSGAAAAAFPLFADRELWVPFAIVAAIAVAWASSPTRGRAGRPHPTIAASAIAAASFVVFIIVLPEEPRHVEPVLTSIAAGESFVLEPPLESRAIDVIISGANISGLDEGTLLGRLDVVDAAGEAWARPIRAGEIADWGAFRSGDLFRTRNPLPRSPGWTIGGEGREASLRGEGRLRVRLERPIGRMIVAADRALPPGARLQIERMEVAPR